MFNSLRKIKTVANHALAFLPPPHLAELVHRLTERLEEGLMEAHASELLMRGGVQKSLPETVKKSNLCLSLKFNPTPILIEERSEEKKRKTILSIDTIHFFVF